MNNKEFIQNLLQSHKDNVFNLLGEVNEKFLRLSVFKENSDFYLEQENPDFPLFSKELAAAGNLLNHTATFIDRYRTACEDQQRFLSVVDKLKTIDFQKLPLKYISDVNHDYGYIWKTTHLEKVEAVSYTSNGGFSVILPDRLKPFLDWLDCEEAAFDTKDLKTTLILNEAGFYSFDQLQKIDCLIKACRNEASPYRGYVAMLFECKKDPRVMLEQEFKTLSLIASEYDAASAINFVSKYQDSFPVPLSMDIVKNLAANNFMEPLEFIPKDKISDPIIINRVKIGDCYLDFYKTWKDDPSPFSVDLVIPKDKLTLAEVNKLLNNNLFDSESMDKTDVLVRDLTYEKKEFRNHSNSDCTSDSLNSPDVKKIIRDFITSPEIKKT